MGFAPLFAARIFSRYTAESVRNPATGRARDPVALLQAFLGRAPKKEEALLQLLGLK